MTTPATPNPPAVLSRARQELARLPAILEAMLDGLDPPLWVARPAPAEWSPVEIVCHLRDEEVENFGARVRAILDGAGVFERIDRARWAVERRYHEADPQAALAALRERRAASLAFLGVGHPRSPAPGPARGDARAYGSRRLGAAAHGLRRPDSL